MELLKRFVAGLGIGAAVVGLAMFALSFAPPSGAESVANPPAVPPPDVSPLLPSLPPGGPVVPAAPPVTPMPPGGSPFPSALPAPPALAHEVKPAKNEVAVKVSPGRTAVRFGGPAGMKVSWLAGAGFHDRDLSAPACYNFVQGEAYRLRLSNLPKHPGTKFYPTLEVAPPHERAVAYLAHNAVPVTFSEAELAVAAEGRLVVKAVYLPNGQGSEPAATVDEVSSARPGAGADPVAAASMRGTLLAVVRLGNVDLENAESPPLHAPPGGPEVPLLRRMTDPPAP